MSTPVALCPECGRNLDEGGVCPHCLQDSEKETRSLTIPALGSESGARFGPYRIQRILGEGGMGTVYLAEQREPLHRLVALKVIKRGLDSQSVIARFESERQALAALAKRSVPHMGANPRSLFRLPFLRMEAGSSLELLQEVCECSTLREASF